MDINNTYLAPKQITDPTVGVQGNTDKAVKASKDFESMFISEMLKPIFDSQEVDPTFGGGNSEKIYRSMMVDEYAKEITKAGGFGIAKDVQAEILKMQEAKSKLLAANTNTKLYSTQNVNSTETKNVASR